MPAMMDTVRDIVKAAVRQHAKGNDLTDAEIDAAFKRTVPGSIAAALTACATGTWASPPDVSLRAKMAAKRLAAAGPEAPAVVPPKDPPKDPPKGKTK